MQELEIEEDGIGKIADYLLHMQTVEEAIGIYVRIRESSYTFCVPLYSFMDHKELRTVDEYKFGIQPTKSDIRRFIESNIVDGYFEMKLMF
jgi:hypothetical protein